MAVMLERAGFEVSALARPKKVRAIKDRGINLLFEGETLTAKPKVSSDPAELGPQDLVIVTRWTRMERWRVSFLPNVSCGPW